MNRYHLLAMVCFISGFTALAYSVYLGEGKVYWLVIFPVIEGTGLFSFLGILLVFLGFILLMVAFVSGSYEWVGFGDFNWDDFEPDDEYYSRRHIRPKKTAKKGKGKLKSSASRPSSQYDDQMRGYPPYDQSRPRRSIKSGGVIFIGPIPIIWGSDKRIGYIMAVVAVILVIIFLIFTLAWIL